MGGLNPLTNGSRIRTSSSATATAAPGGLNPLTNGSRIRTKALLWTAAGRAGLNPLTNGSRIRTAARGGGAGRLEVSIPLRTGLGFEHISGGRWSPSRRRLNPLTNGSRIRTHDRVGIIRRALSQSPYERVSDSNVATAINPSDLSTSQSPYERVSDSNPPKSPCTARGATSQSPYERVSDSNRGFASRCLGILSLNPLTNGSRIRTDRARPD